MNARQRHVTWYVAESRGGDAARSVRLGGILAPTRRLALRWLRRQAQRFADALDPDPYDPWVPGGALYPVGEAGLRDAPAELRSWVTSFREHDYALGRLADGLPYEFVARDATSWYGLVMRPLAVTARTPPTPLRQG
ncbi:hypothetical protein G3I43_06460 [Streptomyces anulatus]|uniref:Uncharacterized protein n=1 Tax=Streptomyces anulatus TaxID=1892 RepID=A0A6G3SLT3_STRAQ|nr:MULTISPECIES: hypothetical protein [unclassified Streptomyces]NEB83823.1 hypothetical protein [Streptomyces anulatus]OLO31555.1 hypothetical protein PZ61_0214020 [Streptomyces sp. MNU77]OWA24210.1 hypothetical protein B9W61_14675 [Streptomyces sp. CS057]